MKSHKEILACEAESGTAAPRSRKWLLWWLTTNGAAPGDIYRAAGRYSILTGNPARVTATPLRCIGDASYDDWRRLVLDARQGISHF